MAAALRRCGRDLGLESLEAAPICASSLERFLADPDDVRGPAFGNFLLALSQGHPASEAQLTRLPILRAGVPDPRLADVDLRVVVGSLDPIPAVGGLDWLQATQGATTGFEPLLRHSQLSGIVRQEAPAIISQWGCWNNWFVSPTQDAMIHGLMLGDQVKAAAVLGSVSLAEDASHFALATRFYSLRAHGGLHGQPGSVTTLGSALLQAQRDLIEHEPAHRGAARSVVLFGDPAQPLR